MFAMAAVVLGTAVVAATFGTIAAMEEGLRRSARAMVGDADLIVEALDDRGFSQGAVEATRRLPGVGLVAPRAQKRTFFRTPQGRGFVELVGIDPVLDPQVHPYALGDGSFLASNNQRAVLLVKDWAVSMGLRSGDDLELMTSEGFQAFRIVGLLEEPDLSQRNFGSLVRAPLGVVQSVFGLEDRVHLLNIKVTERGQLDTLAARLEEVVPARFLVREAPTLLEDLQASVRDFQVALLFFGAMALVAGAFLVFNTLALAVAQQTREIGLMRAAGATADLVLRITVAQGLLLGAAGAALGVIVGQALAFALVGVVSRAQGVPVAGLPISPLGILLSLVLGMLVTLTASLKPAWDAAGISPLMALGTGRPQGLSRRLPTGRLVALAAALVIIGFLVWPLEGAVARALKLAALLALFPLVVGLSHIVVPALVPLATLPFRWLFRDVGLMAERNVRREGGRTGLTVAGFVISLSLIVALGNGATSFSTAGQAWARSLFPGQFVVVSPVDQPQELLAEFQGLAGVEQVSAVSIFPLVWEGSYLTAAAVDPAHYFQAFQFQAGDRIQANREMRRGEGLLAPARLVQEQELGLGDTLTLRFGDRVTALNVAGVIEHSFPSPDNYGALIMPRQPAEERLGVRGFRFLVVSAAPGADLGRLQAELTRTAELFGMQSQTVGMLQGSVSRGVGGLVGLLAGLVIVAVIVGGLSVVNTMIMNIAQRTREIGVLRAQGMTTGQVQRLSVGEAVAMGVLGGLLGIALGVLLTAVLIGLNRTPEFDPEFAFSPLVALAALLLGALSAALAAFYPAGLAARLNLVEALRHE